MGREFELKYAATPEILAAIQAQYNGFSAIAMDTTYFDTPSRAFSARKMTLRLRRENDKTLCTLKTPLADGSRGEWECPAADIFTGLQALLSMGAPAETAGLAGDGLEAVCGARFTRLAVEIPLDGGSAEMALDSGVLLGGGRELPLWEVEVELKSGSDEAVTAFAQALAETFGLQPEPHSKFRRASALAQGE